MLTELKGSDRPKHATVTAGTGAEEAKAPSCHHQSSLCHLRPALESRRRQSPSCSSVICPRGDEPALRSTVHRLQGTE